MTSNAAAILRIHVFIDAEMCLFVCLFFGDARKPGIGETKTKDTVLALQGRHLMGSVAGGPASPGDGGSCGGRQ